MNIKYILAVFLILVSLSNFSMATAYDIETDLDVNQFDGDDYLDLTQSAVGEGMRTTTKNTDFILAVVVGGSLLSIILFGIVWVLKRRK